MFLYNNSVVKIDILKNSHAYNKFSSFIDKI